MMATTRKNIVILGTLDTKGEQLLYLKERIKERGHRPIVIDLSTGSEPPWKADIMAAEIASIAGKKVEELRSAGDRAAGAKAMKTGAEIKVLELFSKGELDGIVGFGGATMANISSAIMQKLPFGVPKVIAVPAIVPVFVIEWFNAMDILAMQTILEMAGMNDLVKSGIERLAGAVCGMTEEARPHNILQIPYPSVAITEYGYSQKCARQVTDLLERRGYHVFSFHAQGISDRAMEKLITQGVIHGVIDIVISGLSDELTQGNRASGKERLDAAAAKGIPQVLGPAGVNMTGCGSVRRNKEKYENRSRILKMDENRSMTRYTVDELREHAGIYAEKLNRGKGPVVFLFPLKGWSSADMEGGILYDPAEDRIFIEELRSRLKPEIEVLEIDCNLEDPEYAEALVDNFDRIFKRAKEVEGRDV
jgi:uncharacterized protein (UPF0261 family)